MVLKIRKWIIIVDKKRSYFSIILIFYPGLHIKYHINVKYLNFDARKDVDIASFPCQADALQMFDMFTLMSVSGLYQSWEGQVSVQWLVVRFQL